MDFKFEKKLFFYYIGSIIFISVICFFSFFLCGENNVILSNDLDNIEKLEIWTLESDDENSQINLKYFEPSDIKFEPYSISSVISTTELKNPVLVFESMHQAFTISLNSEVIYEFGHKDLSFYSKPIGGILHFVELPYIEGSDSLRIDIIPSDDKSSIGLIDIYIAEESDAAMFLVQNNGIKFLISLIIFILGIILLCTQIFISKGFKNNKQILYLALLTINIAIWLISESSLLQFFIGNSFILGNLPYWSIQLILIPFILYMDSMYTPSHKSISLCLCVALIINFVVSNILHFTGIYYFYNSLSILHVIMALTLLYYVTSLIYETTRKNKDALIIISQVSLLVISAFIEIGVFYLGDKTNSIGISLQVGILLYLMACVISTSLKLRNIWSEAMHNEYLNKVAYSDSLTTLYNRNAFERDLDTFKESIDLNKIIITFDLNNLKYFNDNMGHQTGDNYLIFFAEILNETLSEFGCCYRIGGDEFAAILYNVPKGLLENKLPYIQKTFSKFDDNDMSGVAIGYAHYNSNDYPNILDYLHHLDECMFENKKLIKKKL